jgi:hypothetical protein
LSRVQQGTETDLYKLDLRENELTKMAHLNFVATKIVKTRSFIAVWGAPHYPDTTQREQLSGLIVLFDPVSFVPVSRFSIPLVTEALENRVASDAGLIDMDLSSDGRYLGLATWWVDGYGTGIVASRMVHIVDVSLQQVVRNFRMKDGVIALSFSQDSQRIRVRSGDWAYEYELISGEVGPPTRAYENEILLSGGGAIHWNDEYVERRSGSSKVVSTMHFPGSVVAVNVFEDRNLLLVTTEHNEVLAFSLSKFAHALTLVARKDDDWIAFSDSGEFVSSARGAAKVYWTVGDQYLEFDVLKQKFERPDILAAQLADVASDKLTRRTPPALTARFAPAYRMTVLSEVTKQTIEPTFQLKIRVQQLATDAPDPQVSYTVGDQLRGNLEIKWTDESSTGIRFTVAESGVPLEVGTNVVRLSLSVGGEELLSEAFIVTRTDDGSSNSKDAEFAEELPPEIPPGEGNIEINGQEVRYVRSRDNALRFLGANPLRDGLNFLRTTAGAFTYWKESILLQRYEEPYKSSYAIIAAIDDYERKHDPEKRRPTGAPR